MRRVKARMALGLGVWGEAAAEEEEHRLEACAPSKWLGAWASWAAPALTRTWSIATLWAAWMPMGLGWGWDSTTARASVRTVLYSVSW